MRCSVIFILSGVFVVITIGAVRYALPAQRIRVQAENYWMQKAWGATKFDVVAMGDSRTYMGINVTEVIRETGRDLTGFNNALSAAGLSKGYLNFCEQRLDPQSAQPVILLGISPFSLTRTSLANMHLSNLRRRDRHAAWIFLNSPWLAGPIKPSALDRNYVPIQKHIAFHPDGWLSVDINPEPETVRLDLDAYKSGVQFREIEREHLDDLMEKVREWNSRGILVLGFRPPVSQEMWEIEQELPGFDEEQMKREFEAAGGYWIEVDNSDYAWWDGSHLNRESAVRLSKYIGAQLREILDGRHADEIRLANRGRGD